MLTSCPSQRPEIKSHLVVIVGNHKPKIKMTHFLTYGRSYGGKNFPLSLKWLSGFLVKNVL